MRLKLLGPLELLDDDDGPVSISAPKRRAVLAALAVNANRVLHVDELLNFVWDDNAPQRARTALQGHISGIRKLLDSSMQLVTHARGYRLVTSPQAVDTLRFAHLTEQARATKDFETATKLLRAALALWRGSSALTDVPGGSLRDLAANRLTQSRLAATELLADHLIGMGRGDEILADLTESVWSHPLRESLVDRLIACLAQAGRQAEAIALYHETQQRLREEFGVDLGSRLRKSYQALLTGELGTGTTGRPTAAAKIRNGTVADDRAPAVSARLPRNTGLLVAREAELRWLRERTRPLKPGDPGVLLVVGAAGVGKTALAIRAVQQASPAFVDGQLLVDLRGFSQTEALDPDQALMGFLRALGVGDAQMPGSPIERANLYRSLTARKRMIVLLDNAWSGDQVRPLLPGGSQSLIVITSRNRLDGLVVREGAALLTLHQLSPQDAIRRPGVVADDRCVEPAAGVS